MATGVHEMRRRKRPNPERDRIEFRAEAEWIESVVEAANRDGLSLSSYIRLAVNRYMRSEGEQPTPPESRADSQSKKGRGQKG